jgi:hypothetical protein
MDERITDEMVEAVARAICVQMGVAPDLMHADAMLAALTNVSTTKEMTIPKFRKKPVEVEAVQWTGRNDHAVLPFVGAAANLDDWSGTLYIDTPEGCMAALAGDWIIKGVQGEFYPCRLDIFEATYEPVA